MLEQSMANGAERPIEGVPSALKPVLDIGPTLTLMSLPTELHLAISSYLIYPDALSLKHTNRHFYNLTYTGTKLKVAWLLERRKLHLECPNNQRCDLDNDLRFCRGSVALLMRRRREHMECDSRPGLGCLVFGTKACVHKKRRSRWRQWMGTQFAVKLWWWLLALVPFVLLWAGVVDLVRDGWQRFGGLF